MSLTKDEVKDLMKEALTEFVESEEFVLLVSNTLKAAEKNFETSGTFSNAIYRLEELADKMGIN